MKEDSNQITFFAQTNSRGSSVPFGIKRKDRARHMYVIGKTGMGKSTLLENMAIQDIRNGEGIAFIDPHGSTADRIMEYVPAHRVRDVVYFAPFDMEHPVAFNVMEDVGYDKRHLVVSGLLSAFRKIWVDAWSARMEYILSNTLLALLEYEGATLLDVNRMLINKAFRKKVVENVTDPIVKSFWVDEFANYTDRYTQDATPAIQNKVGQFTSNPLIRNIVGQPKSSFDIRKLMDEKKILIMNLSKGRVGEVNATLLGSMLVTKIYLAAMSRADVPLEIMNGLPNFYFYVDEFQNFANESFSDILSEARKYKLNLLIAHQYVEQMEEEVRDAVFGNVGTTVAFRVGPFDAEVLETIFNPQFTATDLVNLGFAQIYLTLMIDGVGSPPFSATTLPPFDLPPERFVDKVIEYSRLAYSKPRAEVEKVIDEWQKSDPVVPEAPKPKRDYAKKPAAAAPARPKSIYESGPAPYNPPAPAAPAATVQPDTPAPASSPAPSFVHQPHHPSPELKKEVEMLHKAAAAPAPRPRAEEPRQNAPAPKALQRSSDLPYRGQDPSRARPFAKPSAPPRQEPERPPLGGAKSLKEALAMATGKKMEVHAPDLKAALGRVAPDASKPKESAPAPKEAPKRPAAELSPEKLRQMLAVEPLDNAS